MKVLFVTLGTYSRVGGIERFNQRVARCLAELAGSEVERSHLIALWDTPAHRALVPSPVGFTPASESKVRATLAFLWHARAMRPDVILYGHILLAPLAGLARLVCRRARRLLFVHGVDAWGLPHRRIPPGETRVVHAWIDRIVAVSHFTAERMRLAYDLPPERFSILPNATDLDDATSRPATVAQPSDSTGCLLSVGRLVDGYKGFDQVIRALPMVLVTHPHLRYEIIGEGPLKPDLEQLAGQLGVADHVHFRGYVDDQELAAAYQRADAFVMPSNGEGFGIVYLEAWKHRLPVIAGNRDAGAEVVAHGVNGLTVDPSSPAEIARSITTLLDDRDLARRLGERGYETLAARYTHERFRDTFGQILKEVRATCVASRE